MKLEQIENEVLHLPVEQRADLAQKLLLSLESPSDVEIEGEWLKEAQIRAAQLDSGEVQPIPAIDARKRAESLLR